MAVFFWEFRCSEGLKFTEISTQINQYHRCSAFHKWIVKDGTQLQTFSTPSLNGWFGGIIFIAALHSCEWCHELIWPCLLKLGWRLMMHHILELFVLYFAGWTLQNKALWKGKTLCSRFAEISVSPAFSSLILAPAHQWKVASFCPSCGGICCNIAMSISLRMTNLQASRIFMEGMFKILQVCWTYPVFLLRESTLSKFQLCIIFGQQIPAQPEPAKQVGK